ncbi:hypothetical protein B1813_03445 [Saccharomonospora piscinae]|uniref:Lipoprotein n=1 Tax=Saccharomonospora piscinae TaxID=687388 RepID=A0A1V9A9L3_SACPI|nr:lipoprotein [Saccharomonospora piscinae]OQO93614.1 hypothetical protein B1813_03445 [Saccharomonospora piscinae]
MLARFARGVLTAALVTTALTACGAEPDGSPGDDGDSGTSSAASNPGGDNTWYDTASPASAGGTVGGDDSPCPLPVTFDVAEGWQAEALDFSDTESEEFAALTTNGSFAVRCEIDAGPAGAVGHLRVWISDEQPRDPEDTLRTFLEGDSSERITDESYRDAQAGAAETVEGTVLTYSDLLEENRRTRAVVVPAAEHTAVIEFSGFDLIEHEAMVPGYLLALDTVRASR